MECLALAIGHYKIFHSTLSLEMFVGDWMTRRGVLERGVCMAFWKKEIHVNINTCFKGVFSHTIFSSEFGMTL